MGGVLRDVMIARLLIILLLALAMPATAVFAQAPAPVGQIVALQGSATAAGADGASRALALKSPVYMNDKVATAAGSRLQIMFTDDSVVSQGEKSSMTIDEYVFTPSKKSDNACSLNLAQGVFRVVTDKITKINPERFKVKTKMATIGIRGCDLGFNLQPGEERVYTFRLQGTEQVVVTRSMSESERQRLHTGLMGLLNLIGLGGTESGTIEMTDSQTMVVLTPDQPARVVTIPWDELRDTLQGVQVQPGSAQNPNAGDIPASSSQASNPAETDAGTFLAWLTTFVRDPNATPPPQPDPPPPNTPTPPTPAPPPTETAATTSTGPVNTFTPREPGGTDWSWGIWAVNGLPDSVEFKSANIVTPTDFQSIANGAVLYSLNGSGITAAFIAHDGVKELVQGTCTLDLQVGGVVPSWYGTFFDGTPGPLYFEVSGNIINGKLSGDPVVYQLNLPGHSPFVGPTSLTAHSIDGALVGPGTGATPITGAIGTYSFSHGTAVQVNGGFGANMRAPLP